MLLAPEIGAAISTTVKGPQMAETQWVCLERQGGRVQRVTLLDNELKVIASHEREPREAAPDDIQLLRVAEVSTLTAALEVAG